MYRLYNNLFIGIGVAILSIISLVFTYFIYQPESIKSNVEYKNHNNAKELFIKQLETYSNENDLLIAIQNYYSYMPYEFDIFTVKRSGKQNIYYLTTESRNIGNIDYYLSLNPYLLKNQDLYNYLLSYLYLLEGRYSDADQHLKEINDIRRYNIEFLGYWKDTYSPIRNTKLSAAIYLSQNIKNPNYNLIITNQLFNIYCNNFFRHI
ncbi:MAG: hypothetical protein U0U66_08045 [Cytophagaceae bacterium]